MTVIDRQKAFSVVGPGFPSLSWSPNIYGHIWHGRACFVYMQLCMHCMCLLHMPAFFSKVMACHLATGKPKASPV